MSELNRNLQTTMNVQKQANLIWNVADILRGLYKPHEYGKVILSIIRVYTRSKRCLQIQLISKQTLERI